MFVSIQRLLFIRPSRPLGVLIATALIAAVPVSAGLAAAPPVAQAGAAASAAAIRFSHAVVVDEQRPGFEPDVKVDSRGDVYTSIPFGFSTTQSFVWSSRDGGNSYQLTPGNLGPGKPTTCAGGGDTDLFLDSGNALYFSDLQGLTNISNSVSTDGGATWSTNCLGAPNTPDDRMWFAGSGSLAAGNLTLFQDYDAVESAVPSGGNQLVETVSHDGLHFAPVLNAAGPTACPGLAADDCVTNNEGISGNQVVDPATGNVFIAHTTTNGSSGTPGVQVSEGKLTSSALSTSASWTESPNLDAGLCPDPSCVDRSGNPEELAGENFASIARDSAGYLYVAFTAGPLDHASSSDPNFGALTAPEQIYVVHSLQPAGANPATLTWSAPTRISGSGISAGTNTFPWITAGSDGRVDVAWYHTSETSEPGTCASGSGYCTLYGASSLSGAEWSVQMGQSLDAHAATPTYTVAAVSESYVKHGQICTNGIGCTTGGDRSLGDFLQVTTDAQGAALVSYVDDTSADSSAGEDAGPEVISRQLSGSGLNAAVPSVTQNGGPGLAMGSVTDPVGDADLSQNGTRTPASANLDLTGASLANGPGNTLTATIRVASLKSLAVSSSLGGPDASWLLRWTVVDPGTTGNGHIFYAGMDNNQGAGGSGKPTFFAGDTAGLPPANPAEHTKYLTYPQTHLLSAAQAAYDATTGTITLHVPLADVGSPPAGTVLYSATAFTATSTTPQSAGTLFNLIDSTTPFELVIGAPGTVGGSPAGPGNGPAPGSPGSPGARCPRASGRLSATGIGPLRLGMTRTRARAMLRHYSTRRRRYQDFYCLAPVGIRAGVTPPGVLRTLARAARARYRGRLVLLLSADRHYALRGVRAGARFSTVRRRLRVGRAYQIGANTFYLVPLARGRGIVKVHRGVVGEIGVVSAALTRTPAATLRLLRDLGLTSG
jgi:hypothetical protein